MRRLLVVFAVALAAAPPAATARFSLVAARPAARPLLTLSGGRELAPELGLWRVPTALVPQLRTAGLVRYAQPDRLLRPAAATRSLVDPFVAQEWWLPDIGATQATPPGPGVPITVIDTGVDVAHPEFAGRTNTVLLNTQSTTDTNEDFHGTAVSSVAAAPENGVGIVGVYPQAVLREYDADLSGRLSDSDLIAAIETALSTGPSVINLSLGGTVFDQALQDVIYSAIRRGSLVVAASGNSREEGNPANFPADMSHVLTVAATDQNDRSAFFSSSSFGVDLAAPGVGILAAVPVRYAASGFATVDGTSFSTPIVAAAAAWVWTVRPTLDQTQLFDVMRLSARDVEGTGFDAETGFGILDIPHALTIAEPAKDPQEPNDDVDLVKPGRLFATGTAPLTTPTKALAADDADRAGAGRREAARPRGDGDADGDESDARRDQHDEEGRLLLRRRLRADGQPELRPHGEDVEAREAVAAVHSAHGIPGLRTRTVTDSTGKRAAIASATAIASDSRSTYACASEISRTQSRSMR